MRLTFARTLLIAALCLPAAACSTAPEQAVDQQADALNTALTARTDAVSTKLAAARSAGRIDAAEAARMEERINWVKTDSARYVREQGFLSAGENASYNRALDEIEARLG